MPLPTSDQPTKRPSLDYQKIKINYESCVDFWLFSLRTLSVFNKDEFERLRSILEAATPRNAMTKTFGARNQADLDFIWDKYFKVLRTTVQDLIDIKLFADPGLEDCTRKLAGTKSLTDFDYFDDFDTVWTAALLTDPGFSFPPNLDMSYLHKRDVRLPVCTRETIHALLAHSPRMAVQSFFDNYSWLAYSENQFRMDSEYEFQLVPSSEDECSHLLSCCGQFLSDNAIRGLSQDSSGAKSDDESQEFSRESIQSVSQLMKRLFHNSGIDPYEHTEQKITFNPIPLGKLAYYTACYGYTSEAEQMSNRLENPRPFTFDGKFDSIPHWMRLGEACHKLGFSHFEDIFTIEDSGALKCQDACTTVNGNDSGECKPPVASITVFTDSESQTSREEEPQKVKKYERPKVEDDDGQSEIRAAHISDSPGKVETEPTLLEAPKQQSVTDHDDLYELPRTSEQDLSAIDGANQKLDCKPYKSEAPIKNDIEQRMEFEGNLEKQKSTHNLGEIERRAAKLEEENRALAQKLEIFLDSFARLDAKVSNMLQYCRAEPPDTGEKNTAIEAKSADLPQPSTPQSKPSRRRKGRKNAKPEFITAADEDYYNHRILGQ